MGLSEVNDALALIFLLQVRLCKNMLINNAIIASLVIPWWVSLAPKVWFSDFVLEVVPLLVSVLLSLAVPPGARNGGVN